MTRASATAFWLCLTIIVSLGLYHTSYRVDDMEQKLRSLNAKIQVEKSAVHVLKAEWDFLSNPTRIENVARKHLDLKPTSPSQIAKLKKISSYLPTRKEAFVRSQRRARLASIRPAARTPRVSSYEAGRLNKRIIFKKTAHRATRKPLAWTRTGSFALANTGSSSGTSP